MCTDDGNPELAAGKQTQRFGSGQHVRAGTELATERLLHARGQMQQRTITL